MTKRRITWLTPEEAWELIAPYPTADKFVRPAMHIGPISISIQASRTHYSTPRVDGVNLNDCASVEVAIFDEDGEFCHPSKIGVRGFNRYFASDHIAGYMPITAVKSMLSALWRKHGVGR